MEIKETNIIVDNIVDNAWKEQLEQERRFFLELPNYLNEIFNRLDKLEKEIKELKNEQNIK